MLKPNIRSLSISSQESYSAVMITDLVAEVPVSSEIEQGIVKPAKVETNLGYDGHLDGDSRSPDDTTSSHVTNGGGITRGVILNAVQFGQPDAKSKSDEKAIQLTTSLPIPTLTQQISEPQGFKDMSFPRKIAFGFSFLPSVLFVLCFAVILPCNVLKPCVEEAWVTTFNDTVAISRLEIPQNVLFTAFKDHHSVLIELHKDTGSQKTTLEFDTNSAYLKCGTIMKAGKTDCIVMDGKGKFYAFNDSHSSLLWDSMSPSERTSEPVILFDCDGDEIREVAVAVSNTEIKIMYGGSTTSSLSIVGCDSIPTKLMPWATNGSSDLIYVCETKGEDKLVKVPQNMWCAHTKNPEEEALILHTGNVDSLKKATIHPIENSLVLWSEDEVSMIHSNGSLLWKLSNTTHSEKNRYILYGNFEGENKQVALLSSNILSGFKVTLLDSANGNHMKSINFTDFEATDVVSVRGKNKDFIIILKKQVKRPTDMVNTALTQINDFSTTIVNLISNEEVRADTDQLTSQEVSILEINGELMPVKELKDLQTATYETTITAAYDEEMDVLRIYLLSTSEKNATDKTTKVRNINIANWNKSKKSKCLGKMIQN